MARSFNIAGPCDAELHYMLPPERRLPELERVVEAREYFVLHAPRQVGKTTALMALATRLTRGGKYAAVLLSAEVGQALGHDLAVAEAAILAEWSRAARFRLPPELQPPPWPASPPGSGIGAALSAWAAACPRPLVVFIDEIDALSGDLLFSVLRQLRSGFPDRPRGFPSSLALIGMRDVRDYKTAPPGSGERGVASPFNIKVASFTLPAFTHAEVSELYAQHTEDTGQAFEPDASARAFVLSAGQPWLVNALARACVDGRPRLASIRPSDIDAAADVLVRRMDTHLDSLAERLREPRVRGVLAPMLAGSTLGALPDDDIRFVQDLGLLVQTPEGGLAIANPIYAQVIPRVLASVARASLPSQSPAWLGRDNRIDPDALLAGFLSFWQQHGAGMLASAPYPEVAAQLVMMAWLDRVANGGGRVDREYAIGRRRIDLCLSWGPQRLAFELKSWRAGQADPETEGLSQLDAYLAGLGLDSGWLVIFDQRANTPVVPSSAVSRSPSGRRVTVIRA